MSHPEFAVHILNDEGIEKDKAIAELFNGFLSTLYSMCPSNSEFAVVRTKLEEACFFAKKSMATALINQK